MKSIKFYSKEFNNKLKNYNIDDKYEYRAMKSIGDKDFYGQEEDIIIQKHIDHISEDYLIDDGYETVVSHGYIKKKDVVCELLMRKLK